MTKKKRRYTDEERAIYTDEDLKIVEYLDSHTPTKEWSREALKDYAAKARHISEVEDRNIRALRRILAQQYLSGEVATNLEEN